MCTGISLVYMTRNDVGKRTNITEIKNAPWQGLQYSHVLPLMEWTPIQQESDWFPPGQSSHYCTSKHNTSKYLVWQVGFVASC